MSRVLIWLIRGYRWALSPLLTALFGPMCRFEPSCSQYALDALRTHGLFRGLGLSIWRVMRCNPWCDGGHDPVPPRKSR